MSTDRPSGSAGAQIPDELPKAVSGALELLAGESATSRTFLGGLVVGAFVGAAVAGASLVRSRTSGHAVPKPKR